MKVFKFGGASVNSAHAIRNVAAILKKYLGQKVVVVFSAMGKQTNALEKVVDQAFYKKGNSENGIEAFENFHKQILFELFEDKNDPVHHLLHGLVSNLRELCENTNFGFDEFYDRIVPYGELVSTAIISAYFDEIGINNILMPAPAVIKTNNHFRDASVDWTKTSELISQSVKQTFAENSDYFIITQGFIGGTSDGRRTTLGREGSDFSASVLAHCLQAESMIVWKDVDGLMNADPVYFENTQKIEKISYRETIELSFYGAKILHPKTIKPLQNKNIPLEIKSFSKPDAPGSIIHDNDACDHLLPFLILKKDQMLVSFSAKDFSFITEDKLQRIFGVFHELGIRINMMQNSAISFSICINHPGSRLSAMLDFLHNEFDIRYNEGLELLTIRHFNEDTVTQHLSGRKIYLEQRSRKTIQLAYKNL